MAEYVFEELVMQCLTRGRADERFEIEAWKLPQIAKRLVPILKGTHAQAEVEQVLRLVVALETRLSSPSAAEQIRSILRAEPLAQPHLEVLAGITTTRVDALRGFLKSEGREVSVAAPKVPKAERRPPEASPDQPISPLYSNRKKTQVPKRPRRGQLK